MTEPYWGRDVVARSGKHLRAVRESYFRHMRFALRVGWMMVTAGLGCIVHALVPGAFETTASRTIRQLHRTIEERETLPAGWNETAGIVPLLLLSAGAALLPWIAGAATFVALPLSLIAAALPLAFLAAEAGPGSDSF